MKTLTGQGFGTGHVMGRAAKLTLESGRATLEESLLIQLDRWRRREDIPMGLILVAEDPAMALLLLLPEGAALNGVVSEHLPSRPPNLPEGVVLLAGVEEALRAIGEGELLLLEPERGRVTVEPSAVEVARLQAKHQPRVLLDEQNFPAFTTEGLKVTVWGEATNLAEAQAAMAAGADGLLLTGSPWDEDALWAAQELVGGGDLALTLRWCLDPATLPLPIETLRTELIELIRELEEENQRAALPRLASLGAGLPGFDTLVALSGDFPAPDPEILPWEQPALYIRVESVFGQLLGLEEALERGATGVIVAPDAVAKIKTKIREWG